MSDLAIPAEQSYHSPFVCITDLKKKQKAIDPIYALIREGIEKKKIKEVDPELIISYLFGIINEIVKKSYFSNRKLSPEALEQLYDMYRDGLR